MAEATSNAKALEPKKLNQREEILERNKDKSLWEWVEIPATDMFDQTHCGVSINFTYYGPGKDANGNIDRKPAKYFVDPETAGEIKRLLKNKERADIRVLQPKQDAQAVRHQKQMTGGGGSQTF